MTNIPDIQLDLDVEALRAKYRAERDKRTRTEGVAQYAALEGEHHDFDTDPNAPSVVDREALHDKVEIVIIGGGFAGLSAGAHLRMLGFDGIRFVEKGGDFGGTWYWNRYPGVQCDNESLIYLPLLEETGYVPTERYSYGAEILAHAHRIAQHFELYRDALFQTVVTELRWLDDQRRWLVETDRGDRFAARYVIRTNGLLDRPKLPAIPGIARFRGKAFHTSRWDYGYSGGDPSGGLTKLANKRVAVVGTGSTAIQVVPNVARYARRLYVIQRTPSGVDVRGNRPINSEWVKSLGKGWQKRRRENFVALTSGIPQDEDLVADGWTDAVRSVIGSSRTEIPGDEIKALLEKNDFLKMNAIRSRIDETVRDRVTAEALKPWYRQFCKRPTFSDEYLESFNRSNVQLIDTEGAGLDTFTAEGFEFRGDSFPVDCVIFATGFEYGGSYTGSAQQKGHPIIGRGGVLLSDEWKGGLRTLHGFYSADFPNLFMMGGSQNGISFTTTYYLDEQAEHIAHILAVARERGGTLIEPTKGAEADWVSVIRAKGNASHDFKNECTPGIYNEEGKVGETLSRADETYGGGPIPFYALVRDWRAIGYPGLVIA